MARLALFVALLVAARCANAAEVRDVTPPGVTPGPEVTGPLVRVPTPPKPPDPPRWRRFFLPATTDAATFVVGKLTVHIAGVVPPAADATCTRADGAAWPCGKVALYSFRRFLHGRAVECFFAPPGEATKITAPCRIGRIDLAEWLLKAGWAKPTGFSSDAHLAAEKVARCASVGIWRGEPQPPAEDCRASHMN